MSNGRDFRKTVEKFSKKFGIDALTVVQKTAIDIHKGIIEGTPRDTGRAASSWNLTKDKIDLTVAPEVEKGNTTDHKPVVITSVNKFDTLKDKVVFYISNNLPYIESLSRGHSKQAPDGWIERVISKYVNFLKKASK